jgi:hypothetical protein
MAAAALRIAHFFTCVAGAVFAGWLLCGLPNTLVATTPFDRGLDWTVVGWTTLAIVVFGTTSARGLSRVVRRKPLVENGVVAECWALAALVTLANLLAHFLVANVFLAIWSTYPDFDGNAAGPLMLALMAYAFALLTVECVLAGPHPGATGSMR